MDGVNGASKKILEHRKYVLREFIESEREYVSRLQIIVQDYYDHIKLGNSENAPPELKNDLLAIFSTLPEIHKFHKNVFLPALESCNWEDDATAVMECFLTHRTQFNSYLAFCKNKPSSDSVRMEYEEYFTSRHDELGHKLNIEDLLIAPVQRLPKYQLLIRDLLKDTQKIGLDSSKIEEALELMMKIPQETNNIICMSLIRGISRACIISHGSLWRQDSLVSTYSLCNGDQQEFIVTTSYNVKNEPRQVFLFDHRILIAAPADSDGFFNYQIDLKTLNGKVTEDSGNPLQFSFTTESGSHCSFKAGSAVSKTQWVADIKTILDSQLQMKKALVFGKPAASTVKTVRMHSFSVQWSGSDSSIDSIPSSSDEIEEHEYDWPEQTGFQNVANRFVFSKQSNLSLPSNQDVKQKKDKKKKKTSLPSLKFPRSPKSPTSFNSKHQRLSAPTATTSLTPLQRPHTIHSDSVVSFDQSMDRLSYSLSLSPRMLRHWVVHKLAERSHEAHIYFPKSTSFLHRVRSSGSSAYCTEVHPNEILFIAREDPPDVAEQVYTPQLGQVFSVEDISHVDVWKAKILSGKSAGESVWVQKNSLEEYSASINVRPLKKVYQILNNLSIGRFSTVKLARSKSSKELHALKIFRRGTTENNFYRELCIGTRMKHRNLLHYNLGIQQPFMTISMEYINGRELFNYLVNKSSVTELMVATLMGQLLDGLHYMHSRTLCHLDIRPENIMIDLTADLLKIIDYGAARHSGSVDDILSENFETCFSYEYLAPEIFQHVSVGPGTDMWGVGLIIYTIFHGHTPFSGESPVRIIANVTGLQYSFLTARHSPCSQYAVQLIKDILVLSPSQRPSAECARERSWFTGNLQELTQNKVDLEQLKNFITKNR